MTATQYRVAEPRAWSDGTMFDAFAHGVSRFPREPSKSRTEVVRSVAPASGSWLRSRGERVAAQITPTISELLNAANIEYVANGTPAGMRPFMVNGRQVSYSNDVDGVSARVWITSEHQVVIAYEGTGGGENVGTDPEQLPSQILADLGVFARVTTPGEIDALNFARSVKAEAAAQGFGPSNVFVTGHSLGGIEAEFVASRSGVGGAAFEATGLPFAPGEADGRNFVDIVTYGDPVASYASDVRGEQPFAPTYHGGALPHYGKVIEVGDPADQEKLTEAASEVYGADPFLGLLDLYEDFTTYHSPGVQGHDLGVTFNPYSHYEDDQGDKSAPVTDIANDMVSQLT